MKTITKIAAPTAEKIQEELSKAKSIDDFFGKEGIMAKLFAKTIEQMMVAELDTHLGYPKHSPLGYHAGNSRNGSYARKLKSSNGQTEINVPRDRNGEFNSEVIKRYQTSSNEIEDKITGMYAKGMTVDDIHDLLEETYGINISPATISNITEKVMPLVKEWQQRPLEEIYAIIYLDCIHTKLRINGKVSTVAVYNCLGINLEGKKETLGIWVSDQAEGANFWLSVISDIQARGVKDVLIACVDGLSGFKDAIQSIFPDTIVQKCIIHQIRNSLKYVSYKHRKEFVKDLKGIYAAPNREIAEENLIKFGGKWKGKYALSVRSWENNWEDLSVYYRRTSK